MKKKFFAFAIVLATILMLAPIVFAADNETPEISLLNPYYMEFSGRVTEINPYYNADGSESGRLFVLTESAEGQLMNFVVDEKTLMLTDNELQPGANITGFYLGNMPAILIYPPQMHAALLAVDLPEGESVKAAIFDENLLSDDGNLKLNIGPDTKIELPDGSSAAEDALFQCPLVVFYSITTRSIPPQTTPSRIIVLVEEAASVEEQQEDSFMEVAPPIFKFETDAIPISVENILLLDAPPVYTREDGTVMVPLRAVAEALGYKVGWQDGTVTLDGQAVLSIGSSVYTALDNSAVRLQTAAELSNGSTYVPLNFFREVLKMNNAFVFEEQVHIDNGEKWE